MAEKGKIYCHDHLRETALEMSLVAKFRTERHNYLVRMLKDDDQGSHPDRFEAKMSDEYNADKSELAWARYRASVFKKLCKDKQTLSGIARFAVTDLQKGRKAQLAQICREYQAMLDFWMNEYKRLHQNKFGPPPLEEYVHFELPIDHYLSNDCLLDDCLDEDEGRCLLYFRKSEIQTVEYRLSVLDAAGKKNLEDINRIRCTTKADKGHLRRLRSIGHEISCARNAQLAHLRKITDEQKQKK